MMRIALLGYGSWALAQDNPPELILRALERKTTRTGIEMIPVYTPVEGDALAQRIDDVLDMGVDALIGIGLAAGSPVIRAETTAINTRDYRVEDAAGACPRDEPICDGPLAYRSDLPNADIVAALNAAEIPARISHHAGTHCCNQMLYLARHMICARGLATRAGFIHVPYTHAHVAMDGAQEHPSMSLTTLTQAMEIVLQVAAQA